MTDQPESDPAPAGAVRRRYAREGGFGWTAVDAEGRSYEVLDLSAGGLRLAAPAGCTVAEGDLLTVDLVGADDQDHATAIVCHVVRAGARDLALSFDSERPELAEAHRRSLARLAKAALGIC